MRLPCAICGAPILYDAPYMHPAAFVVDEIVPVSLGGSELDWNNLQPAHRLCNGKKGNKLGYHCEPPKELFGEPEGGSGWVQRDVSGTDSWSD